jgi:hypothetical protein
VDYSHINFEDYLYNMTTPAFSFSNPLNTLWNSNKTQTSFGANAGYTGIKNLMVAADYKFYRYDQSGDAWYFGGKTSYTFPEELVLGAGIHRMSGELDKNCYLEYRAFASKKIGHADLTIDAINVHYDKSIDGIRSSYAIIGAAGYEINRKLKVGADVEYARNPEFDKEVRALARLTYTFDTKFVAEGGTKSEK